MTPDWSDARFAIRACVFIASIQLITSCLELLFNKDIFRKGQWMDWEFMRTGNRAFSVKNGFGKLVDRFFRYPNILLLIFVELLLALYLDFLIMKGWQIGYTLFALTPIVALIGMRHSYSNNGSDQLVNIIFISAALNYLAGNSKFTLTLTLFFIAFQAEISYATSGAYKLINKEWRRGNALKGVLSTGIFGNRSVAKAFESYEHSYLIASFLLIFGEIMLGMSFLLPPELCFVFLAAGLLFHGLVALVMGLNTFIWAFGACYPAILFASGVLHPTG